MTNSESKRMIIPPGATNECRTLSIYGLDCTGMIWVMTTGARLAPVEPKYNFFVEAISDERKWTKAFKASPDYKDLTMKNKGQLAPEKMENGDIIFWNSHIGVYLYGYIYQSNGTPKAPGCNNNMSSSRGPRMISLSEVLSYNLGSYKVFRVSAGAEYTLKPEVNFKGYNYSPFCEITSYIETATINITVKGDSVILNYINNVNPQLTYKSPTLCTCLSMSFSTSMIEFTNLTGVILENNSLWYDITYTATSPTDVARCDDDTALLLFQNTQWREYICQALSNCLKRKARRKQDLSTYGQETK